jgi:hypothetical protein
MASHKKSRMFLVVVRTNLDELPILLTDNRRAAMSKARNVTDADADLSADLMGVDAAGRIVSAIITFVNGAPKKLDLVRDWDEEKEAATAA